MREERRFFLLFLSDFVKSFLIDFTILIAPETISIIVLIAFNTKNTIIATSFLSEFAIRTLFQQLLIFIITDFYKYRKNNDLKEKELNAIDT